MYGNVIHIFGGCLVFGLIRRACQERTCSSGPKPIRAVHPSELSPATLTEKWLTNSSARRILSKCLVSSHSSSNSLAHLLPMVNLCLRLQRLEIPMIPL